MILKVSFPLLCGRKNVQEQVCGQALHQWLVLMNAGLGEDVIPQAGLFLQIDRLSIIHQSIVGRIPQQTWVRLQSRRSHLQSFRSHLHSLRSHTRAGNTDGT